jgi:hypothetical protein
MGAEPYSYEIEYSEDIKEAMENLKRKVFESGDFRYSEMNPSSIQEALENAMEDGTASILDIFGVSSTHQIGFLSPLSENELNTFFATNKPTLEQIEKSNEFWDSIGRCEARYIVLYEGKIPEKLFIAGYSAD